MSCRYLWHLSWAIHSYQLISHSAIKLFSFESCLQLLWKDQARCFYWPYTTHRADSSSPAKYANSSVAYHVICELCNVCNHRHSVLSLVLVMSFDYMTRQLLWVWSLCVEITSRTSLSVHLWCLNILRLLYQHHSLVRFEKTENSRGSFPSCFCFVLFCFLFYLFT